MFNVIIAIFTCVVVQFWLFCRYRYRNIPLVVGENEYYNLVKGNYGDVILTFKKLPTHTQMHRLLHNLIENNVLKVNNSIFIVVPLKFKQYTDLFDKYGLKFHHVDVPVVGNKSIDLNVHYYIWTKVSNSDGSKYIGPDLVPQHSTTIESSASLVTSKDRTQLLLVHEYSQWKMVTGFNERKKCIIDNGVKEVDEETGINVSNNLRGLICYVQSTSSRWADTNSNLSVMWYDTADTKDNIKKNKNGCEEVEDVKFFNYSDLFESKEFDLKAKLLELSKDETTDSFTKIVLPIHKT